MEVREAKASVAEEYVFSKLVRASFRERSDCVGDERNDDRRGD